MFASKSIIEHIFRGAVGFGAVAAGVALAPLHPVGALAMLPVALISLRGCPTCWTVGLIETIAAKAAGRPSTNACVDGSCALDRREAEP